MAKDNELGAAHVLIGADLAPLNSALRNAQRMTNTTMERMTNFAKKSGTELGRAMGRIGGLAGFVGIGGTMALATREAIKQMDAMKGLAAATGIFGGRFREAATAVDGLTTKLQKLYPASRASITNVMSFLIREGQFQGKALDKAMMASFGLTTFSGTPMENARFIRQAKHGQVSGEERFGLKFGRGAPSQAAHLDKILEKGRQGLGIQQRIAEMPVERGRRVLVTALDKLADAVRKGVERLGVLDRLFAKDPQGTFGISPAKTLFQQGVDDVVHPIVRGAETTANRRFGRFVVMGSFAAGAVMGSLSQLFSGVGSGGMGPKTELQQRQADIASRVGTGIRQRFGGYRPGTAAFNAIVDAGESGMGAASNAVQRLDDATTPGADTMADMLEGVSDGFSDSTTRSTGVGPQDRAERGGVSHGLQTALEDNTKSNKDLTNAVERVGGLQ